MNQAGATRVEGHEPLAAAGGSLRDMTRVAGANPRIWVDIFLDNAGPVREALAEHRRRIDQLERGARRRRCRLPRPLDRRGRRQPATDARGGLRATPARLQRLRVHVPDRPGVLAGITQALGAERINIEDFELQPLLAGARRRAHPLRRRRGARPRARRSSSRRRATAWSSRRSSRMKIEPAAAVRGAIAVPGAKSISHRGLLLGALAEGETEIRGFGRAGDTEATIDALRALGVEIEGDADTVRVRGVGLRGLRAPAEPIDCGNAGTLMRLLAGILAGQDGSVRARRATTRSRTRPMERIAVPLRPMGASVETTDGLPPVRDRRAAALRPIRYELPVASAQVKSAVLLAGLYADGGPTTVVEPVADPRPHRAHAGARPARASSRARARVASGRPTRLRPLALDLPGDFSSAAPFLVAADARSPAPSSASPA